MIMVIGDIMLDEYLIGTVDRISPEAPVPVVRLTDKSSRLGGAANVAMNVAALDMNVILIGVLGVDKTGDLIRSSLNWNKKINSQTLMCSGHKTIKKTRIVADNYQQLLRVDEEFNNPLSKVDNDRVYKEFKDNIENCEAVILSDYNKNIFKNR